MKYLTSTQILVAGFVATVAIAIPQLVRAQLPLVVDSDATPKTGTTPAEPTSNNNANSAPQPTTTASASGLKVSCQDLKTVVQKGDREAVMVTWNYDGFGKDFTPAKRCQMVSERLQQAAALNGGTFKDLQLASGTVNSQAVICALQSSDKKCTRQNLLFTLKPENARNPDAIIQKIFSFAQDGSSSLDESASRSSKPQINMNLGTWEQKAFTGAGKRSATTNSKKTNTGF